MSALSNSFLRKFRPVKRWIPAALMLLMILVLVVPRKTSCAETGTPRSPVLHLITISDNIDHTPRMVDVPAGHMQKSSEDEDMFQLPPPDETDCFNSDVATLTLCFIRNIPSDQLKIHHFVTDTRLPKTRTGRCGLIADYAPIRSVGPDDLTEGCNRTDCRFTCIYGAVEGLCHLKYRPDLMSVRKLTPELMNIARQCGKGDAIVVYYTGHGEWDSQEGLRYRINGNILRKNTIRNSILKVLALKGLNHQNRVVILSDCCSVWSSGDELPMVAEAPGLCPRTRRLQPLFQKLFFSESGCIDLCAAREGWPAITLAVSPPPNGRWWHSYEYGGLFTIGLVHTLDGPRQAECYRQWKETDTMPNQENEMNSFHSSFFEEDHPSSDEMLESGIESKSEDYEDDETDFDPELDEDLDKQLAKIETNPLAMPVLTDDAEWSEAFTQISERTNELFLAQYPRGLSASRPEVRRLLRGNTVFPDGSTVMRDHRPYTFTNLRQNETSTRSR